MERKQNKYTENTRINDIEEDALIKDCYDAKKLVAIAAAVFSEIFFHFQYGF